MRFRATLGDQLVGHAFAGDISEQLAGQPALKRIVDQLLQRDAPFVGLSLSTLHQIDTVAPTVALLLLGSPPA